MSASWESLTPASFAQRSLWAFALRYRTAHLNEMVIPWRIQGPLEAQALQAALTDLTARHPTLRARLSYQQGHLYQVVMPVQPVVMQQITIEGPTPEARLAAAMAVVNSAERQRIDILSGPTMIVRLLRLDAEDHVLCLVVHHSMCDGWSMQVMVRELLACYEARLHGGGVATLPALTEQYADVAEREAATYAAGGFAEEIRYWQTELDNPPPPLALPTIAPRRGNRDWRCGEMFSLRDGAFMSGLREAARGQRVSPFALSLAALAVLLRQRSGREDMVFGVPTLNRWSEEAMHFVGYATSLMPLRVRPAGDMSFAALTKRVNTSIREMLAYGRVPLEVLLRETPLAPLGNNVFPIWCQYLEGRAALGHAAGGLRLEPLATERTSILADLDVDLAGMEGGWRCDMAYRKSLFEAGTVQSLMADYISLLGMVQQDPTRALDELVQRLGSSPAAASTS